MFNFQDWIETFKLHNEKTGLIYNDAANYGVSIQSPFEQTWRVLGIHHLTPDENRGKHNIFIEVLCKQGDREGFRAIHWTWEGRQPHEPAPPVFAGQKPPNELVDLPLHLGMVVSVWTDGSDMATGFSSGHPDEGDGNTIGHHSFFVCFQEIDPAEPEPPDPEPEPPGAVGNIRVTVNVDWINSLSKDEDGNVTFDVWM